MAGHPDWTPSSAPTPAALSKVDVRRRGHRWLSVSAVAAFVSVVVLYIWDDVMFAAPIVALTGLAGPWVAFCVFSIVYSLGSFVLAVLAVRAYDQHAAGRRSWLAAWAARQSAKGRTAWVQRLLASGKAIGFAVASFVLGGILTTFLVRFAGRQAGIERVAAASSVIFGVSFTAFYTGIAGLIFSF